MWPALRLKSTAKIKGRRISTVAYTGEPVRQQGFEFPVVVDVEGLEFAPNMVHIVSHETGNIRCVIGPIERAEKTDSEVTTEGPVLNDSPEVARVVVMADKGHAWQASIGADPLEATRYERGQSFRANGRIYDGPAVHVTRCLLREVSVVATGADFKAVAIIANRIRGKAMTFEEYVATLGLDPATLSDEAKAALMVAFNAESAEDATEEVVAEGEEEIVAEGEEEIVAEGEEEIVAEDDAEVQAAKASKRGIAAQRAEALRLAGISRLAAKHPTVLAQAIKGGWGTDRTKQAVELATLRASRGTGPAVFSHAGKGTQQALTAAVLRCGGYRNLEKDFSPQVLEQADKHYRRIGLNEMLIECAQRNGYSGGGLRNVRNDLPGLIRAAFSSNEISEILSNVANKFLLQGWKTVEDTWSRITARRSVQDFKQTTSYRLTGAGMFEKVGPDGELKHGKLSNQSFNNQAETYGLMLSITRTDYYNDDLGALTDVPTRLGRGGALKLNDIFWTTFLDNASFFTSGNNNYFTGASTNLQSSSMTTAVTKFRKQTDPDGFPLGVNPKTLLVPPELEAPAQELFNSQLVNTGGSSTTDKVPNENIHKGKYQVEQSAYLSNSNYTGYSTTAWYLLADQNECPVIETAFLSGQESPTVETTEPAPQYLGVVMRGYFDFGCTKQDYRGGVKSKGAA